MKRIQFIDRMAQGKISRRQMLSQAGAFGVGLLSLPKLSAAAEVLTCMEWGGYDAAEYFKPYVDKHGAAPNFSIFSGEEDALAKVRAGFAADVMHPCNYSVSRFVNAKLAVEGHFPRVANRRWRSRRWQGHDGARRLGQLQHRLPHRSRG
jgi:spermidine/putrescine transport system substrate-binding protein